MDETRYVMVTETGREIPCEKHPDGSFTFVPDEPGMISGPYERPVTAEAAGQWAGAADRP